MRNYLALTTLCVGLPLVGHAQSGEIFIPGADSNPFPMAAPEPQNPLARCMMNASAANCSGIGHGGGDGVTFESAVAPEYETLVLDLDGDKVAVSHEPPAEPPAYTAPQPKTHGKVALPAVAVSIEFDYNSASIRLDQLEKLTTLVEAFNDPALKGTSYAVIGHTDAVGSDKYNCDLSIRRATSVAHALQDSYVSLQLYSVGFGEHVLKDKQYPDAPENRRVTFLRLPDHPDAVLNTAQAVCRY